MNPNHWTPKQCPPRSSTVLDVIQGNSAAELADHLLTLIPAIPADAVIHDNCCGTGTVTWSLLARLEPPHHAAPRRRRPVTIHATDMSPLFLQAVVDRVRLLPAAAAAAAGTVVRPAVMDAQALRFPAGHLTHSITNLGLQAVPNPVAAARQVHRSLRPGGVALATAWGPSPHMPAFDAAHRRTRGGGGGVDLALRLPREVHSARWLRDVMEQGGFADVRMSERSVVVAAGNLRRWAEHLWGFMGAPEGGWTERDEERWEMAIDAFCRSMRSNRDVQYDPVDRSARMKMTAYIAIGIK